MSNLPAPRYSLWQALSASLALAQHAIKEVRALAREPGPNGEKGEKGERGDKGESGSPGIVAGVQGWTKSVHYAGVIRTFEGATYQAVRDTANAPPHDDWRCLAAAGRNGNDGRSFDVLGTFDPKKDDYRALNIVALNGASFAAKSDKPGPCPGEGWQLIASQGKRGEKGERGERGMKGDRGDPGSPVVGMKVSDEGLLTLTNGDGSTVELDLYPLLVKVL